MIDYDGSSHPKLIMIGDLQQKIKDLEEENAQLKERIKQDNAVCICGCPEEDHEYVEVGHDECGIEDHECLRSCPAVAETVFSLRAENDKLKNRIVGAIMESNGDPVNDLPKMLDYLHGRMDDEP